MTVRTTTPARHATPPGLLDGWAPGAGARPLAEHVARFGALGPVGDGLLDAVERAGLAGRGGAGFPLARKLRAVRAAGRRPVVVANGCETDPLNQKDRVLLATDPHLVLDGLEVAARLVGARRARVAVHEPVLADALDRAVAERPGPRRVEVHLVPPGYVSGEAGAVAAALTGRPALPTGRPPRLAGVDGRPTAVCNVETLARLALVARGWDGVAGPSAADPVLTTVTGAVRAPGVYEDRGDAVLGAVLDRAGAAPGGRAVLLGSLAGTWAGRAGLDALPVSGEPLRRATGWRAMPAVWVQPAGECGLADVAAAARALARESAGQCGPCMFGLPAMAADLDAVLAGDAGALARLRRRLALTPGRGACHHPDGFARMVGTGLDAFRAEVVDHLAGRCPRRHDVTLPVSGTIAGPRDREARRGA